MKTPAPLAGTGRPHTTRAVGEEADVAQQLGGVSSTGACGGHHTGWYRGRAPRVWSALHGRTSRPRRTAGPAGLPAPADRRCSPVASVALHPAAAATPVPSAGPTPTAAPVSRWSRSAAVRRRDAGGEPDTASSRRAQGRRPATRRSSDRPCRSRARVSPPQTRLALQARLDRLRQRYGIPGISVAIVLPDGATWSGVSGMADVGDQGARDPRDIVRHRQRQQDLHRRARSSRSPRRERRPRCIRRGATCPAVKKISVKIKVRQLLDHTSGLRDFFFHPSIDQPLLSRPARRWDADARAQVRRQAVLGARQELALLEHELPRSSGWSRRPSAGSRSPTRSGSASSSRSGSTTPGISPRSRRRTDVAHGYRFTSASTAAPAIDLSDGTPLVPFTSVVTAAGGAGAVRLDGRGPRALGAGLVRRRGPPTRIPRRDGRSEHRPPRSSRRSRTATASRSSRSTGSAHSATPVACSGSGRRCATCQIKACRSPSSPTRAVPTRRPSSGHC